MKQCISYCELQFKKRSGTGVRQQAFGQWLRCLHRYHSVWPKCPAPDSLPTNGDLQKAAVVVK